MVIDFNELMNFLDKIDEASVNSPDTDFWDGYNQAVYDVRDWVEKHTLRVYYETRRKTPTFRYGDIRHNKVQQNIP